MQQGTDAILGFPFRSDFYQLLTSDGKPAARVLVYRYEHEVLSGALRFSAPQYTDDKGRLLKEPMVYSGLVVIPRSGPVCTVNLPQQEEPITLPSRTTELVLRVTDGQGKPLADATILLLPDTRLPTTTRLDGTVLGCVTAPIPPEMERKLSRKCDAQGKVVFTDVPQSGRFRVAVGLRGAPPRLLSGVLTLGASSQTRAHLTLARNGVIEGRVIRKRNGAPLTGVRVFLSVPGNSSGFSSRIVLTDAAGSYRFNQLFIGPYDVWTESEVSSASHHYYPYYPLPSAPRLTLSLAVRRGRHDITMVQAATLIGTVIGPDGFPMQGVTLHANERSGGGSGISTNINGVARLPVKPGTYNVGWARAYTSGPVRDVRRLTLREGETLTLRLGPPARARFARAPDVEMNEVGGGRIRFKAFLGKWVVLAFTSPGFENHLLPLDALLHRWQSRDVVGLVINLGPERPLKDSALGRFRVFQDSGGKLQEAFAVYGWPTAFLIGPDGSFIAKSDSIADSTMDTTRMEAVLRTAVGR